ncbi:hypothetical protein CDD83_1258 [Cordyceps sp. RAO-2017]|nr:hypothetical protein CDD83_1258 [Cordyceps sp. RAO-2017]
MFRRDSWFAEAVSPAACGLPAQLFQTSLVQNEVVFSSDGLSLLSLDRLYSLKSALSSYSRTLSPPRLEDAVDELRRFVLATGGATASKADILRSYDWLTVSDEAIAHLDSMYRRAYGGPDQVGAISGISGPEPSTPSLPVPVVRRSSSSFHDQGLNPATIGVAVTTTELRRPSPLPHPSSPSPKIPLLKLQTAFDLQLSMGQRGDESAGSTVRPDDMTRGLNPWSRLSIGRVLSSGLLSADRGSKQPGPQTPNGYDDISPITRGEWGFLMVNNALGGGRTVAVETC